MKLRQEIQLVIILALQKGNGAFQYEIGVSKGALDKFRLLKLRLFQPRQGVHKLIFSILLIGQF
ncbi:hypothetical protein SAE01_00900 [Segetibacter aerophilus]|uniref:Uncharacterized protein n=1 Tax=Segetibacter aerophilus TaxID=670293 RepID=A0A512B6K2_9BACT|nr:hypothetical protein SAE01_00900 [Segetibacter aerophilus]